MTFVDSFRYYIWQTYFLYQNNCRLQMFKGAAVFQN
jgi:hypothetical protein